MLMTYEQGVKSKMLVKTSRINEYGLMDHTQLHTPDIPMCLVCPGKT